MPFAGYKNFDVCVAAQIKKGKSEKSARKICGYLQKKAEGNMSEQEYTQAIASEWIAENVLRNTLSNAESLEKISQ